MKITKLGHCCLLVEVKSSGQRPPPRLPTRLPISGQVGGQALGKKEERGVRILTDPGAWSTKQNEVKGVDYIFITHEHPDHFHLESLKTVLKNNPQAKIVTNRAVGKLLDVEKISYELLEHGGAKEFGGVHVEGHGEKHAVIYKEFGQAQNTGYFFASRFLYPGDAFYLPAEASAQAGNLKKVEILALPVAGPWMKIAEAIDYAKALKPKFAFPVHDGMLNQFGVVNHLLPQKFLPPEGIEVVVIPVGGSKEF